MKYTPLSVWDFGHQLLASGDLDPVYIGLHRLDLSPRRRAAWLLAYWCFYHPGVSCQLSDVESGQFWDGMEEIAARPAGPRGTERRHFRGAKATEAVQYLRSNFSIPHDALEWLLRDGHTFQAVSRRVQQWPLFGPWIAFKVADMIDRCTDLLRIDFRDCELSMYSEPVKGAELVAAQEHWAASPADVDLRHVCTVLIGHFGGNRGWRAPPLNDRPVGLQEIETILCKFKSHVNGHYPLGKDSRELQHALVGWGPLADKMRALCPTTMTGLSLVEA